MRKLLYGTFCDSHSVHAHRFGKRIYDSGACIKLMLGLCGYTRTISKVAFLGGVEGQDGPPSTQDSFTR